MSDQTDPIEPGDLIRTPLGSVTIAAHHWPGPHSFTLIAKGSSDAPWTRHDGSAVNPVPGAKVQAYPNHVGDFNSQFLQWEIVQFYRVTREAPSQPPAPQPGWVATVTIEYVRRADQAIEAKMHGGGVAWLTPTTSASLPWQPPPPPPWEPEVGKDAWCVQYGTVTVIAEHEGYCWTSTPGGGLRTVLRAELSPPKGGA